MESGVTLYGVKPKLCWALLSAFSINLMEIGPSAKLNSGI